jgi:hypothetical protein
MPAPRAFDVAAGVLAVCRSRIQQAIFEIGEDSSGFSTSCRWRSAAINAARSFTVIATSCSLVRPAPQNQCMVRLHLLSASPSTDSAFIDVG